MLSRIVLGSLTRQRRRKLLSVVAVALGIAVATAVGTTALDVGDKVSRELRSFGANISVIPAADGLSVAIGGVDYRPPGTGAYLAEAELGNLKKIFWRNNIVAFAPFLSTPAAVRGRRIALVGSWFERAMQAGKSESFRTGLRQLHAAWRVQGRWPADEVSSGPPACLIGRRLATSLGVAPGQRLTVETGSPVRRLTDGPSADGSADGRSAAESSAPLILPASEQAARSRPVRTIEFEVAGILETGGPEDDQLFAPLAAVQKFSGLEGKVRRVEVSALTKPEDAFARSDVTQLSPQEFDRWFCSPYVSSIAYQIQQAIPGAEAKPVFQVAETEGKVLNRVSILMGLLAGAALASAALAVASMMLAAVLERRAEIGLFKSLGATDARVAAIFLLEALAVGLVGGVAGYMAGSWLARGLSAEVFGSPASFHWAILPAAVALALGVALIGSALPLARGLKISPATVLRD